MKYLLYKTRVILNQRLHLHISLKKSLLGDMMAEKKINTMPVDGTIYTDASRDGWSTVFGKSENVRM